MAQEKVLKLEQLERYHGKNVALMDEKDTKILADAKLYADGLGDNYDPAGTAQTKVDELANGQVKTNQEAIEAINDEETGILKQAKDYADGKDSAIAEAKKAGTDAQGTANKNAEDITALQGRMTTAEGDIDAVETDMGDVDTLSTTNKTVVGAINEVLAAVGTGGTASVVTVTTDTTTEGALKSYTIKQGSTTVGVIDIPKDMVVESGEVVTNPEGQAEGTYIKLVLANVAEPLFINVGTLVDIYKAQANATQVQLTIDSATREISATIVAGSITATELADNAVTTVKIADANVTLAKLSATLQASIAKADAAAPQTALDEEVNRAKAAEAKALDDAKAYTDEKNTAMDTRVKAVEEGVAGVDAKIATAKTEAITEAGTNADTKDAEILKQAKAYADSKVDGVDLSGIATNAADIDKLEASLAEGGATANAIADAKAAGTNAQAEVDALETTVSGVSDKANANETAISTLNKTTSTHAEKITALEEKVGEGWVAITDAEIDALFE